MKNYSNFINGFINKYEIKDEEILIYTPLTKNDEPYTMPATKENIKNIEERLENQYKLVIENQYEILKHSRSKNLMLLIIYTVVGFVSLFTILILLGSSMFTSILSGIFLSSIFGINYKIDKSENDLLEELKEYKRYMENRIKIEEIAEKDKNITKYLSQDTISKIEENKKLKEQNSIESVYNIDLMDKISLIDLRKILTRYKIAEALQEEQNFKLPHTKTMLKKRVLKQKKNIEENK